eukprot:TRINITY_DN94166_c0_g1_i1.p1 TRINITY_DN94166_c0_g1~~TRINITY_DN94166_c0_g1_i1.p1  ORF type:complete len:140 (-),score=16.04 TRINITY_DN94166_c0_g1_i1:398-817(-)
MSDGAPVLTPAMQRLSQAIGIAIGNAIKQALDENANAIKQALDDGVQNFEFEVGSFPIRAVRRACGAGTGGGARTFTDGPGTQGTPYNIAGGRPSNRRVRIYHGDDVQPNPMVYNNVAAAVATDVDLVFDGATYYRIQY